MLITVLQPDGKPAEIKVSAYLRWRDKNATWIAVTDGRGRHWRIKEKT